MALRTVGGSVLAGVGWSVGSDLYERAKKKHTEESETEENQPTTPTHS